MESSKQSDRWLRCSRFRVWLAFVVMGAIVATPGWSQSPGGNDPAQPAKLVLMCLGLFDAGAEKRRQEGVEPSQALDLGREWLAELAKDQSLRKQLPTEKDRDHYIEQGREVVRSGTDQTLKTATQTCANLVSDTLGDGKKGK